MLSRLLFPLVALALGTSAFAQKTDRPRTFAGVPFGVTPEEAIRVLSARPGVIIPETLPTLVEKLELTGGNFAAQEVLKWTIEFVDKKFAAGTVVLKPDGNGLAVYRDLRQSLTAKYGQPTGERKPGLSDAEKKTRAQATGKKADSFGSVAYWKFAATIADKNVKAIVCEAAGPDGNEVTDETKIQVTVHYVDETLKPPAPKAIPGSVSKGSVPVKKEDL